MICGVEGRYMSHLRHVREIIGFLPGVSDFAALALMITSKGAYFIADTQVRPNPTAEELADMAALAAAHVQRFNIKPKIAFVSHSDFGSYDTEFLAQDAPRHRAVDSTNHPEIEADGEMQGDTALVGSRPEIDIAAFEARGRSQHSDHAEPRYRQRRLSDDQVARQRALPVGPILIGPSRPAHILTPSVTARGVLNMTAVAAVEAQERAGRAQPSLFG